MVLGNSLFNLDFQEAKHTNKLDITKVVSAYSTVFMGMSLLEYFQEIQQTLGYPALIYPKPRLSGIENGCSVIVFRA